MPIFLSEEEFQSCSHDSSLVAEKADAFIKELLNQLETVKAEAEAASITALEQKYFSLSSDFSSLQSQHSQINVSQDEHVSVVAQEHKFHSSHPEAHEVTKGKKIVGDGAGEQTMKEKEKEKDTRQQSKISDELKEHDQALKTLTDVETLKMGKGSKSEIQEICFLLGNLQLSEENRQNCEDCQKLRKSLQIARIESENLGKSLEQSQNDVRAYKEEIERQKTEMQANLREKEAQLAEAMELCSVKEDVISHLEHDIARRRIELKERKCRINEILRAEATLRSEVDEQKRMIAQFKKKSENLVKEKDDLGKENQVLSKQLDDAGHGKKIIGDGTGEQTMKEKEKEKDTRIQMLEKTVERLKDEHKTENDKLTKMQKTVVESGDSVSQVAQPVISTQPGSAAAESLSSMHMSYPGATAGQVISSIAPTSSLAAPSAANVPAVKTFDNKEKKFVSPKANFEARKTGRKLVRRRILKPEDSQADSRKPLSHNTIETQGTPMLQAPLVRKRLSLPSTLDLQGSIVPGETSSDVTEPAQKKPKNSETPLDG